MDLTSAAHCRVSVVLVSGPESSMQSALVISFTTVGQPFLCGPRTPFMRLLRVWGTGLIGLWLACLVLGGGASTAALTFVCCALVLVCLLVLHSYV